MRESPFKVDKPEDDPHAFGNRPEEVKSCVQAIINKRHIIISGPRGIGKSSLACQIQNLFAQDYTLAKRCEIDLQLDRYLTCYYGCSKDTTLASLAFDLLFRIENECYYLKTFKTGDKTKFAASLNLGIIKVALTTDVITNKPASVATQFVSGLKSIYESLISFTTYEGLNILVDELDKLDEGINFGHFFKLVHEYITHDQLRNVNFILVGQKGIYTRLYNQDPSIERIVKHVPLSKLESEECKHILSYASAIKAKPPFSIKQGAEELILKIASGFPYLIHLLGDSAFSAMSNPYYMGSGDVLIGLERILKSDKREKYYWLFSCLSPEQRVILMIVARHQSFVLPIIIPFEWIKSQALPLIKNENKILKIIKSLSRDGHLIINEEKEICQFNDELFRIFLALIFIEERELMEGKLPMVSITDADVADIVDKIKSAEYGKSWEHDQEI